VTITTLTVKAPIGLRLDVRSLAPATLAALAPGDIERLRLPCGNQLLPLGELFGVARTAADGDHELRLAGDLSHVDRIGWQLPGGRIVVDGPAGDYLGALMRGGEIEAKGDAGLLAACEMAGGRLNIAGDAGDFAASPLPGSMDGMRGGTLVVRGHAGERFGDRMRRGTALVLGNAGDFLASRMVAGTIGIGGSTGAHVGFGMRRGTVVFAGSAVAVPGPTFVPLVAGAPVFWQLLARDLARHGGVFAALPQRHIARYAGDVSAGGKGELIVLR